MWLPHLFKKVTPLSDAYQGAQKMNNTKAGGVVSGMRKHFAGSGQEREEEDDEEEEEGAV